MPTIPGYWMNEASGVLRPAVEAYIERREMTDDQIASLRAYLRQWIAADCWDMNPYMNEAARLELWRLRRRIDGLTTRAAIDDWLSDALDEAIDPL